MPGKGLNENNILCRVERPSRYIGGEVNSIKKDLKKGRGLRLALAFPDVYEVGMSHLGIQILYSILNSRAEIAAERVFAPWPDLEKALREKKASLRSLENRTPLGDFDVIGFSLQYELSFTNVLNMLDLAGVPLRSAQRGEDSPIVIAGGPCAFNPAPMADFIDAFAIGEGEELAAEMALKTLEGRKRALPRQDIIRSLADIEGVYVPVLGKNRRVRKRAVADLDSWRIPLDPIVPLAKAVHDRINLEIARGCTRGCRFCQAGMVWRPVRERSQSVLEEMAREMIASTGYEELSLLSLSTGDYSRIEPLLASLMNTYCGSRIAVSLPSLRTETLTRNLIEQVKRVRKTSFTLAPEAGSERLRRAINKGNTEEDLVATAQNVFAAGWRAVKLYFMIGLPGETEEDLEAMIRLAGKTARAGRNRRQVTVSVSSFIPKPHTPFQWERQAGPDEIREKQAFLKRRLRDRNLVFKWHDADMSLLEGIFSRGDEKLGRVIEAAFRKGARFDGWTDLFQRETWISALEDCGIDARSYLQPKGRSEKLPWDNIDCGLSREFLLEEAEKALGGEITPDCRVASCTGCGACSGDLKMKKSGEDCPKMPGKGVVEGEGQKYRVFYAKKDASRFLSHLETTSALIRALRRSGASFKFSGGFHPHPKISFVYALPVGVESDCECAEMELNGQGMSEPGAINQALPRGMEITKVEKLDKGAVPISADICGFRYRFYLAPGQGEAVREKIELFMKAPEFIIRRQSKQKETSRDIRPLVADLFLDGQVLEASLLIGADGGVRPSEVLGSILALDPGQIGSVRVKKIAILRKNSSGAAP